MVSTSAKGAESGKSRRKGNLEFSAFESLLKAVVKVPKAAVDQAERAWEKGAARRRRKRRGRAEG